jgi:hypothetical protein
MYFGRMRAIRRDAADEARANSIALRDGHGHGLHRVRQLGCRRLKGENFLLADGTTGYVRQHGDPLLRIECVERERLQRLECLFV